MTRAGIPGRGDPRVVFQQRVGNDRTIVLVAKDRKWRCCFTIGHTPRVRLNNVAQAFHGSSRNEYYDDKLPVENNW